MKIVNLAIVGTLALILSLGLLGSTLVGHGATPAAAAKATAPTPVTFQTVIVPDSLRGSDKRNHDSFIPASFVVKVGQKVTLQVYNTDNSPHSITSMGLGINFVAVGEKTDGVVAISTFTFVPKKAGVYHWKCMLPCDNGGANAWAMQHDGFMAGTFTVQA